LIFAGIFVLFIGFLILTQADPHGQNGPAIYRLSSLLRDIFSSVLGLSQKILPRLVYLNVVRLDLSPVQSSLGLIGRLLNLRFARLGDIWIPQKSILANPFPTLPAKSSVGHRSSLF